MFRNCLLILGLLITSFSAHADYRPNHGGWAHGHDCEGSELENCKPHHHTLRENTIRIAVRELIHLALMEYLQENDLSNKFGHTKYWKMRESLKEEFIEYFKENPKELLEVMPSHLVVRTCDFPPPEGVRDLEHSVEECEAFQVKKTLPSRDPSEQRVARPNIEDFIENYLQRDPKKI